MQTIMHIGIMIAVMAYVNNSYMVAVMEMKTASLHVKNVKINVVMLSVRFSEASTLLLLIISQILGKDISVKMY